ncbi:MAG: pteridine reductase [Thermoleophilia bacterium]|nr:pteridine reductase [Thermoleophilia bacterium]
MGRALAEGLVADGWDVFVHARDPDRAAQASRELRAFASAGADLGDIGAIEQLARSAAAAFAGRGLDLLVNSASSFEQTSAWADGGADSWARAFDVNARAPYLLTSALLPLISVAGGLVVNISDRAPHDHWEQFPLHAASKAALEALTLSGARSLARAGVRVNAVVPRTVMPPDDWSPQRIAREHAVGQLSSPARILDAVLELAADATRSGEILHLSC